MTDVVVYYSQAVSTDDGYFRVAAQVVKVGEPYTGGYAPALLETREEVQLNLAGLQPHTVLQLSSKFYFRWLENRYIYWV